MIPMPLPVAGERQALLEYLKYQHTAFLAACHGLTDDQARSTPTVSALSVSGLIKHVTLMEYSWTLTVAAPSEPFPAEDPRSLVGMMADFENKEALRDDESLTDLLMTYNAQNAETIRVFTEADLDATTEVPPHIGEVYPDTCEWTVRWVLLHIIEEFARHAGQADIIRESIDGATMYELLFALDGS
jgi:uncharacterized damage-inducible protein DinB